MYEFDQLLDDLSDQPVCGYLRGQNPATEPTALAGLALLAAGRPEPGLRAADWLAESQHPEGSVGVAAAVDQPRWTTSLAVLTWLLAGRSGHSYQQAVDRAVAWTCSLHGDPINPTPILGHDTTLVAWPWVDGTHSWLEPTALHVVALKAAGQGEHPRTREAVRVLLDRHLPDGGCNYGNTIVLGNTLRPHVQPTGIALLALAGEALGRGRIARSLDYLLRTIGPRTTTGSLAWALTGLAAHGRFPGDGRQRVRTAWENSRRRGHWPHLTALTVLAAMAEESPLIELSSWKKDGEPAQRTGEASSVAQQD